MVPPLKSTLVTAVLLRGRNYQETLLKCHLLAKTLPYPTRVFTRNEIIVIAEELEMAFSDKDIIAALTSTCLFDSSNAGYILKDSIRLSELWGFQTEILPKKVRKETLETREIYNLLFSGGISDEQNNLTPRKVLNSLRMGVNWIVQIVEMTTDKNLELDALPAFWQCMANRDTPIGFSSAETSNADALSGVVECYRFLDRETGVTALQKTIPLLLKYLASFQIDGNNGYDFEQQELEWNGGGFHPQEDQPGSEYPTVDATWDAVIALSLSRLTLLDEENIFTNTPELIQLLDARLIVGVKFLLRQQLPDGGWGIYRYRNDSVKVESNEYTTSKTITALALARACRVFEDNASELYKESRDSLMNAYRLIHRKKIKFNSGAAWLPHFKINEGRYSDKDALIATMWVSTGLLSLTRTLPELKEEICVFLKDFVRMSSETWQPNHSKVSRYRFRVPLKKKLNSIQNMWQFREDTLIVLSLLNIFNLFQNNNDDSLPFDTSLWDSIETVIGNILSDQHKTHGHWNDVATGKNPFIVMTLFSLETLAAFSDSWKR